MRQPFNHDKDAQQNRDLYGDGCLGESHLILHETNDLLNCPDVVCHAVKRFVVICMRVAASA